MSLFDAFYMSFEAKGLKATSKEVDEAEKGLNEYEKTAVKAEKQTQQMDGSLLQAGKGFKDLQSKFITMLAPLAAVGVGFAKVANYAKQANEMEFLAKKTNMTTDSFQALTVAVSNYGGNSDSLSGTILKFKEQGIKDIERQFDKIAQRMDKLGTDAKKLKLGEKLGLDESTTRMLMQGTAAYRKELEKAQKYKLYSKEDLERTQKFEQVQRDIRLGTMAIGTTVAQSLLPGMTAILKVVNQITDFFTDHSQAIKVFLAVLGVALIPLVIKGLWGIVTASLALLAANPVLAAIAAAIVIITLLVDDLLSWMKGAPSVLGDIFGSWTEFKNGVVNHLKFLGDMWNQFVGLLGKGDIFGAVKTALKAFISMFTGYLEIAMTAWNNTIGKIGGGKLAIGANVMGSVSSTNKLIQQGNGVMNSINNNPLNFVPQGAVSNMNRSNTSNKTTKIGEVKVYTQATDAKGIAGDLSGAIRGASQGLDNGLKA